MNNSLFFINPVFPWWLIALLVIPLFSFLIWKEVKRKQKFLLFRIIAQCVVLISILGLLLKPGFVKEINSSGLVLLTPGYEKNKVDSLLLAQPRLGLIHLPETSPYRDSRLLTSFQDISDFDNEILFVVGEGLPSFALEIMDEKKFQFIPSGKPIGIIQLQLPEISRVNQQNKIQGFVNVNGETTLTLLGPGGREDSLTIKKNGICSFSLRFKPKHAGLFVYSIQYKDDSGTRTEQIPMVVTEEQKLSILFLQKFPNFEVRQLKNFLAENGHRLALRYQVSKDNYRVEFANLPSIRTAPLTPSVLQTFDLVIVDSDGLEALSSSEKSILEESIHNGLGLLLLSNKAVENDKLRYRFLPVEMKRSLKDTAHISLPVKQYTLPILPLQLTESPRLFPVSRNGNRIFSAYTYNGLGKTGIQLLQETYRLALEGNIDDYAAIWAPLIEKAARNKNEPSKIKLENLFPVYQDEPLQVEVISSLDEAPTLNADQETLPLIEHIGVDNLWLGKTWAGEPGWHTFSSDSSILHYFVSEPSAWKTLQVANQLKLNERESVNKSVNSQPDTFHQQKPISSIIFYILFLVAAGFLWLAPKI